MKNLKKMFGALLTLVISFCAIGAVSAASTGSIKVTGTESGKNYDIYKIFDLTLGGANNDKVAYTIDTNWADFFKNGGLGEDYIVNANNEENTLNSITINGEKKYINITSDNIKEFSEAALEYIRTKPVAYDQTKQAGKNETTITFNNLDLGYYLIYPRGAADLKEGYTTICSIDSTTPNAEVNVKATYPAIEKTVDDYSVEVGQIVNFTITGKVPVTTGYETYTYEISDIMSNGLLFNEDIANLKVYFGETQITTGTLNIANNGFVLTFDMTDYQNYKGQTITVEYQAKVTKDAIDSATTKNKAVLKYSNDPKNDESFTINPPVEVYLYSADILVIKVDGNSKTTKLEGAKFVLTKLVETKTEDGKTITTKYYYKANMVNGVLDSIEWVTDIEDATEYTTDANGNVRFEGLEDGTYYLVETEAPEGYNLLVDPITVNVNNEGNNTNAVPSIEQVETTVENFSGTNLPTTGGMGTTLFIIIGSLLTIISAVIFVTNKRMAKEM